MHKARTLNLDIQIGSRQCVVLVKYDQYIGTKNIKRLALLKHNSKICAAIMWQFQPQSSRVALTRMAQLLISVSGCG